MNITLEPAGAHSQQLNLLIMKATMDVSNEWFFYDGAHNGFNVLEHNMSNTWLHENFVALNRNREIIAYFEGVWMRPLDIITGFRIIHFGKQDTHLMVNSLFSYMDYLFTNRGCKAFNWTVAHMNKSALIQYDRFVRDYCGRKVGIRHHAQKSYTGRISDINLYELTKEEYFEWKDREYTARN